MMVWGGSFSRGAGAAAWLLGAASVVAASAPARAQTQSEVKDAMEMMVGTAAICGDYLGRPEVLEQWRGTALGQLVGAGMSDSEAEGFMDEAVRKAMADTSSEMQKQVACEIVNIPTLQ